MRLIQYPLVVDHANYRFSYKWVCPRDQDTSCLTDEENLVCATCGFECYPELVSKVKIDPNIPDPTPDDDLPF